MTEWKDSYDEEREDMGGFVAEDPVSSEYSRLVVVGGELAKLLDGNDQEEFIKGELMPLWHLWKERVKLFVSAVEARESG